MFCVLEEGRKRAVRGNRGEEVPARSEGAGRTRGADMARSERGCPAPVPRGDTNTAPAPRVIHTHDPKHGTRRTHPEKEAPALSGGLLDLSTISLRFFCHLVSWMLHIQRGGGKTLYTCMNLPRVFKYLHFIIFFFLYIIIYIFVLFKKLSWYVSTPGKKRPNSSES